MVKHNLHNIFITIFYNSAIIIIQKIIFVYNNFVAENNNFNKK